MDPKKIAAAVLGFTALLSLSACRTQLMVSPVKANSVPPEGQVYFLSRVEHLATLDRELAKCEVNPSLNLLAHAWFRSEVDALGDLRGELRNSALLGLHPKCPTATHQPTSAGLGTALQRVQDLLPKEPPAACGQQHPAHTSAYEKVFREILRDFLRDPVLVSGVDWGTQCPKTARSLESLTDSTDLNARLAQLTSCPAGFNRDTELAEVNLSVLMRASVTANTLPDMNHAYTIDYLGMTKGTKQTEYLVEKYPNGTLKSVNSKIDDRTAQVIQGTLRGALRLAAASGGFPVTFDVAGAQVGGARLPLTFDQWRTANEGKFPETPLCKARILQLLRQRSDLEAQTSGASTRILALIKEAGEATAAAGKLTKEAADLQKQLDALPAGDPGRKALEEKIEKLKAEAKIQTAKAEQLLKDKAALEEAQGGSLGKFAAVRKQLTITTTHLFRAERPAGATAMEEVIKGADVASAAWFDPSALTKYCSPTLLPCDGTIPKALSASIAGYLGPQPVVQTASKPTEATSLIYREPAHGLLLVCKERACLATNGNLSATPEDTLLVTLADFPQLGILAFLPLTNDTFQNNAIEASFSASGSLEKLKYVSNARAEAAAKAFEGVSADVLAFTEAKQGAKKKELETEKAELDAEKALLEARLARDKARQALEDFHNPGPEPEPVPEPGGE